MVGKLRRVAAAVAFAFTIAAMAALFAARSIHGSTSPARYVNTRRPVLNPGWRLERDRYQVLRRGLSLGIPSQGYAPAIRTMRRMEARARRRPANGTAAALGEADGFAWKPIGPQPILDEIGSEFGGNSPAFSATGRITALAIDPRSGGLFAGTAGGGVWRSADGGASFVPIFDSQPTQAIGALAIDPTTSPSTIYAGTGEGNESADSYYGQGIFKSTDLGATWTPVGGTIFNGMGIAALAVDTSHAPPHLFAALTNAVSAGRGGAEAGPLAVAAAGRVAAGTNSSGRGAAG